MGGVSGVHGHLAVEERRHHSRDESEPGARDVRREGRERNEEKRKEGEE